MSTKIETPKETLVRIGSMQPIISATPCGPARSQAVSYATHQYVDVARQQVVQVELTDDNGLGWTIPPLISEV